MPDLDIDIRLCPGKDGTGLCRSFEVIFAESEQVIEIVALEKSPLFGVFQNTVGQELLEDLPENHKEVFIIKK